jgi:hypothetical protein
MPQRDMKYRSNESWRHTHAATTQSSRPSSSTRGDAPTTVRSEDDAHAFKTRQHMTKTDVLALVDKAFPVDFTKPAPPSTFYEGWTPLFGKTVDVLAHYRQND